MCVDRVAFDCEQGAIQFPAAAATFRGFREWATSDAFPERLKASYIGREVILDMSPEDLETHSKLKDRVSVVISSYVYDRDLGEFYPDGILVTNEAAKLSTEPDASFVSWDTFAAGRAMMKPGQSSSSAYVELVGTPDWVLEVVSRSSVVKDTVQLRQAYHAAGVAEYWLVDARHDDVQFQILRWRQEGYVPVPARKGWRRSFVFGCRFALERKRHRMGHWRYALKFEE
jgi:Uma2 family endonuclease